MSTHQIQHREASIITHALITEDVQPTHAVRVRIPPRNHRQQKLHCPAHECTLTNVPSSAAMSQRRCTKRAASVPMHPHISTANGTNFTLECSMIWQMFLDVRLCGLLSLAPVYPAGSVAPTFAGANVNTTFTAATIYHR